MTSFVLRNVRVVEVERGTGHGDQPIHLLVRDGRVDELGPDVRHPAGLEEYDADGRWLVPGLWDAHVHLDQWTLVRQRLDLAPARSAAEAVALVADRLRTTTDPVVGWGHRSATWSVPPTARDLDAVSGDRPVVLISGDGHHGWLNTAGQRLLALPESEGVVEEAEWFTGYARLTSLLPGDLSPRAVGRALEEAAALGVTGIVDFEFGATRERWAGAGRARVTTTRVRAATYAEGLDLLLAEGWRDGDPWPDTDGLVTTGPLKVISDGSLNTRTAWCCERYTDRDSFGAPNLPATELRDLMDRARDGGLHDAVHAIGDRAVGEALAAFAETEVPQHRACPVGPPRGPARVRPARRHRERPAVPPDRRPRSERGLLGGPHRPLLHAPRHARPPGAARAGLRRPVSPLDPWLAIRAAVGRETSEESWHPEQAITLPRGAGRLRRRPRHRPRRDARRPRAPSTTTRSAPGSPVRRARASLPPGPPGNSSTAVCNNGPTRHMSQV